MKHCIACIKFSIVLILLTNSIVACSGSRAEYRPQGQRYSKASRPPIAQAPNRKRNRSSAPSQELFRRIITKNTAKFVGNNSPQKSPAIVVGLVTRKGEIVVGLGNRNVNNNVPPDGDTLFGIGSISKLFTGMMLAQAVANGDAFLSTKANDWLDKKVKIDDRITLKHLVTHFSGLSNFPENISKRDNSSKHPEIQKIMPAKNYSQTNLENCLKNKNCRPNKQPGNNYLYSNLGIGILGIALQNHYGFNDFNSLNQAKVTRPLNMQKTSTNIPSFLEKNKSNLAQGYQYDKNTHSLRPVPFSNMGILAGSGELISSANDMNKFLNTLTGLSQSSLKGAAQEVKRELNGTDKQGLKIAYAHDIKRARDGGEIHFKSGITAGYSAIVLWRDNPKVGLIIMANHGKFRSLMSISNRLIEIITQQLKNER